MNIKKYVSLVAVLAVAGSFALLAPALAENNKERGDDNRGNMMDSNKMKPNVVGKVSAINGNTITVVSKRGPMMNNSNTTTFTVDATNAKILRGETTIAISDIAVGDTVVVQGTITGTNVVATIIRDGKIGEGNDDKNLLQIEGNGQPVVAGSVTAISGNTITIKNKSNITYTIDATNAKFYVNKIASPTISNIAVGDNLIVQGIVNGTSVTASSVIDQNQKSRGFMGNMMNNIGNFFKRFFGF